MSVTTIGDITLYAKRITELNGRIAELSERMAELENTLADTQKELEVSRSFFQDCKSLMNKWRKYGTEKNREVISLQEKIRIIRDVVEDE